MDIEKIATAAVESAISKTSLLSASISRGDKEPSYDGNVYIHEDSRKTKKNIKIVPLQIKGKQTTRTAPDRITYPISIIDLNAYQQNGGAMYFVVYIDKPTGNALKIYYTALLPFKIMQLLKDNANKSSLSVPLASFPENEAEITAIFVEFFENARLQISFAGRKTPTIEDLRKQGSLKSLTIRYSGLRYSTKLPGALTITNGREMFVYANVNDYPSPIPVEYYPMIVDAKVGTTISKPVLVGSRTFFESYNILLQERTEIVEIGNCLTIELPGAENTDANAKAKITIHTNGSLNQRLSSLPFISALIKEGAVTLGSIVIPVHFESEKLEQIHYSDIELQIDSLHRVRRVLDKLHITKDLELDQCDNGDYWRLNAIIDAIENGATIYNMKEPPYFVSSIDIANIRIAMLCDKTNDGGYKLRDFFGTHVDIAFGYDEALQEPHVSSQYCILKKNDFLELDNIMFKAIVNDVISINTSDKFHADQSNLMMLEMLRAYDENHNSELLDSAEEINDWLLSSAEESAKEIALINKMQIILRRRLLSYSEKQDIAAIISDSDDPTIKAGAFIILGEKDEAERILLSMDDNIRNQFMKYPIYHLYELLEDNHEDRNAENAQHE